MLVRRTNLDTRWKPVKVPDMTMKMNRLTMLILNAAVMTLLPSVAMAQLPADLASKKDFSAGRASSTDPKGRNGDARSIAPGQTLTLMDVKGSGRITHIWFTIASPS